jgi:hypothetical protein
MTAASEPWSAEVLVTLLALGLSGDDLVLWLTLLGMADECGLCDAQNEAILRSFPGQVASSMLDERLDTRAAPPDNPVRSASPSSASMQASAR